MSDEKQDKQVKTPVDGCVVDWKSHTQVNPKTGATYDFDGNLLKTKKDDKQ